MGILKYIFFTIQVLISIALIAVVTMQTTKSEGLTGTIGGQMTPSFKGKPGMEEQLRTWTIYISVAWFAISIVTAALYIALP